MILENVIGSAWIGGFMMAGIYAILFPIIGIIEGMLSWVSDGEYKFRQPMRALTAHMLGYKDSGSSYKRWYKVDKGRNLREHESINIFFMMFFGLSVLPGLVVSAVLFWQVTAIIATAIALAHTARFATRVSKKLEIHVKKAH